MEDLGIDLYSKYSEVCGISEEGEVTVRRRISTTETSLKRISTTETSLKRFFGKRERAQVTLESGPVTPWLHRLLKELGHKVTAVNPRRVRLIAESARGGGSYQPLSGDRLGRRNGRYLLVPTCPTS